MNEPDISNLTPLSESEMTEIHGGLLRSIAGGLVVHVFIEAYNDWNSHVNAFNDGRARVN